MIHLELLFDLPGFNFFGEGNTWTGSRTKSREEQILLRARIVPDKQAGQLTAQLWKNQDVCFEKAKEVESRSFPLKAESLEEIQSWLSEEYEKL